MSMTTQVDISPYELVDNAAIDTAVVDGALRYGFTSTSSDQTDRFLDMQEDIIKRRFGGIITLPYGEMTISQEIKIRDGYRFNIPGVTGQVCAAPLLRGTGLGTCINQIGSRQRHFSFEHRAGLSFLAGGMSNIRLVGTNPAAQMIATTLSGLEAAAQSVLSVSDNTGVQVGDACLVILDSGAVWREWWAPVSAVGAGTVTIGDGDTAWDLPFQASSGNRIFFFPYAAAIYLKQCYGLKFSDMWFSQVFTEFCLDDSTIYWDKVEGDNVEFGIEAGYNIDGLRAINFGVSKAIGGSGNVHVTNSSAVIDTIANGTATLRVGQKIADITSLPTLNFPEHTRIISIDSPTQVTVSDAYGGSTGTVVAQFFRGVMAANGPGAQPFKSPTGNYGSGDNWNFENAGMAHAEMIFRISPGTTRNVTWHGYVERVQRLGIFETQGSSGAGIKGLEISGKVSQSSFFTGPALHFLAVTSGDPYVRLKGLQDDTAAGSAIKFPWIRCETDGFARIEIVDQCILETDQANDQNIQLLNSAFSWVTGQDFRYNMGGGNAGAPQRQVVGPTGGVIQSTTWGAFPGWNAYGIEQFIFMITSNASIPNPTLGASRGHILKFIVMRDGSVASSSYTYTFGPNFINNAGSTVAVVSTGATSTGSFIAHYQADNLGRYVLLTNYPPTFI